MHRVLSTGTLTVDGTEITLSIERQEDFKRSLGHGEMDALTDFSRTVTPNDVVWDVGANVGSYALVAALGGATVHAFEPAPGALGRLRENVELNDVTERVTIHPHALGATNDDVTLAESERSGTRRIATDEDADGETVQVRRGDELSIDPPDVLKIDVEGAEMDVLRGLGERLNECRVVLVEYHDEDDRDAIRSYLADRGFSTTSEFDRTILRVSR